MASCSTGSSSGHSSCSPGKAGNSGRKASRVVCCYIVEAFEKRKHGSREFVKGLVCLKGQEQVFEMYVNSLNDKCSIDGLLSKKSGQFVTVINGVLDVIKGRFTLNDRSKIFLKSAQFTLSEELQILVNQIQRPVLATFEEVRRSPAKRRVCVDGVVQQVGPIRELDGGRKVRNVVLTNNDQILDIACWGRHAELPWETDVRVCIANLAVNVVHEQRKLETTVSTELKSVTQSEEIVGNILASSSDDFITPYEIIFEIPGKEAFEIAVEERTIIQGQLTSLPQAVQITYGTKD